MANQQCGPFNHLGKVDPKQCRVHTPVWTEPSNILLTADAVDVEVGKSILANGEEASPDEVFSSMQEVVTLAQVPDAIDMGTGEKCVMKAFKSGGVYEDTFFSDDIKASGSAIELDALISIFRK